MASWNYYNPFDAAIGLLSGYQSGRRQVEQDRLAAEEQRSRIAARDRTARIQEAQTRLGQERLALDEARHEQNVREFDAERAGEEEERRLIQEKKDRDADRIRRAAAGDASALEEINLLYSGAPEEMVRQVLSAASGDVDQAVLLDANAQLLMAAREGLKLRIENEIRNDFDNPSNLEQVEIRGCQAEAEKRGLARTDPDFDLYVRRCAYPRIVARTRNEPPEDAESAFVAAEIAAILENSRDCFQNLDRAQTTQAAAAEAYGFDTPGALPEFGPAAIRQSGETGTKQCAEYLTTELANALYRSPAGSRFGAAVYEGLVEQFGPARVAAARGRVPNTAGSPNEAPTTEAAPGSTRDPSVSPGTDIFRRFFGLSP